MSIERNGLLQRLASLPNFSHVSADSAQVVVSGGIQRIHRDCFTQPFFCLYPISLRNQAVCLFELFPGCGGNTKITDGYEGSGSESLSLETASVPRSHFQILSHAGTEREVGVVGAGNVCARHFHAIVPGGNIKEIGNAVAVNSTIEGDPVIRNQRDERGRIACRMVRKPDLYSHASCHCH